MIGIGNIIQLAGNGGGGGSSDFASITGLPTSNAALNPYLSSITNLENNEFKYLYWASVSSSSGTITIPTNATVLLGEIQGVDALVETIQSGHPTGNSPVTSGGSPVVVSSFDTGGNYVLSGIPSAYPVAVLFVFKIKEKFIQNINLANVIVQEEAPKIGLNYAFKAPHFFFNSAISTEQIAFIAPLGVISNLTTVNINMLTQTKPTPGNSGTWRVYVNSNQSLTGAVKLGTYSNNQNNAAYGIDYNQSIRFVTHSVLVKRTSVSASLSDDNFSGSRLVYPYNFTSVETYIIVTQEADSIHPSCRYLNISMIK